MSLEVTGKLVVKYDTQQVNDRFKKREFVIEIAEEICCCRKSKGKHCAAAPAKVFPGKDHKYSKH